MTSSYLEEYCRVQLDCSSEKTLYEAQSARMSGLKLILDGLPTITIAENILKYVTLATLSEQQIGNLTGTNVASLETAKIAALKLYGKGVDTVIITMGAKGVLVFSDEVFTIVGAPLNSNFDAEVIGNVFNTVLPLALGTQFNLLQAVKSAYQTTTSIILSLN
ncbi:PfkB family carbohydrate kinase [Pedobacter helvus]|uniref:PfkB family carbohydrate kinase n=1 Tax=Pedobacter helvus TaxID=2563444 RepID=A0ABW9JQS4_9SPHI|nr:PfkB family carbohydrate kinase [Pedobacter ureilyticus]